MSKSPSRVKLLLAIGNHSEVALSIPLAECTTFSNSPLKWLRFLGFTIYGQQGYLSETEGGADLNNYTAQIEPRPYYFVSKSDPRLIDVDAIDDRTMITDSSQFSTGRQDFRRQIIDRDGTCVLTGDFEHNCTACHLIPHLKGDEYMSKLFDHRGQMYNHGMVPVVDINDARNGILLYDGFHRPLDRGDIAFLKTPNFALGVEDVPYSHQPLPTAHPESRLTLQHPEDMSLWPPAIILDLRYGAAAVQAWGPQAFLDRVRTVAGHSYYGGGGKGKDEDEGKGKRKRKRKGRGKGASRKTKTAAGPSSTGTGRYELRSGKKKTQAVDTADRQTCSDALDVVMTLWLRAAREGKRRQSVAGRNDADIDQNENIQKWLQSVEESSS
ncbi:hypothetical protein JVU11DRAFT_9638 [Chiua virens]|nr:hypothetical protein JVU11DRAFT_9638 [Chiua virens]